MTDGDRTAEPPTRGTGSTGPLEPAQHLLNSVEDAIFQLDAEGRFVVVNDAFVATSGYTRDELLGEDLSLVLGADDVRQLEEEISSRR